jgi:hypothetical protein
MISPNPGEAKVQVQEELAAFLLLSLNLSL